MNRGDIVTVAPPGEFGKRRPALVLQAVTGEFTERVTVALITSDLLRIPALRVFVEPAPENGLKKPSEVAVDNIQTFSIGRIGSVIGSLDAPTMLSVDAVLRLHLDLP